MIAFNKKKFEINAYDNDKSRIDSLKKGKSLVSYIPDKEIKKTLNNTKYYFKNFSTIKECDVIIICLPTPLKRKKPDLSHLKENFSKISKYLKNNQMIILENNTYQGYTEEIYLPIL